jgi:hypothetical protein
MCDNATPRELRARWSVCTRRTANQDSTQVCTSSKDLHGHQGNSEESREWVGNESKHRIGIENNAKLDQHQLAEWICRDRNAKTVDNKKICN